jgi:hypothetical protein
MYSCSLAHLHQEPFLLFIVSKPFNFILGEGTRVTLRPSVCFFPSPKKLGVWIKSCWEDIFCHLPKNQESGKDLRNF